MRISDGVQTCALPISIFMRCVSFSACTVTTPSVPPDVAWVSTLPLICARVFVPCTSIRKAPASASFLLLAVAVTQDEKLDETPPLLVSVACSLVRHALNRKRAWSGQSVTERVD